MTIDSSASGGPILAARRISKSFGEVQILFSVDFDVRPGEVHALMGENGAGKSTLVKILSGFEQPTSGEILLDGKAVTLPPNGEAEALGVVVIHQELNLAEHLTVAENLFLGREITRNGFLCRAEMRRRSREILDSLGLKLSETTPIRHLSIADRQMVEIAKAISRDARVLFMDEPTAVLSPAETGVFFEQVRRLRDKGVGIVFVSHKLDEVMALSDRVTILRDGQWIATHPASELDGDAIAQLMVGRELKSLYPKKQEPDVDEAVVLSVSGISTDYVKNASFDLRKGEILGFSGLIGSGRTELMEAIVGLTPRSAGEIRLHGRPVAFHTVDEAFSAGVAYMTKDRKGKGLLLTAPMAPNLTLISLGRHKRHGFLNPASEEKAMETAMRKFDVRVRDQGVLVGRMSGGNQQKLLLAKIMEVDPGIIIIDEPTRGVDVGTKQQIYHFIAALAREGKSIIVISSEMPEIIGLATRVMIMREGEIVGSLEGDEINEQEIMRYSAGLKKGVAA
ncbi:MAG: sugar ABC transporter ATP-binding protein [Shinella sp.]|nr:sugar ABC transporter ATP-binding protein [Shinella sp.]